MDSFSKKNKISIAIIIAALMIGGFLYFFNISGVEARSGCCSWHGGVCGCRCCDGTPLSAKCAPYYPSCYTKPAPKYEPPAEEPPAEEQSAEEPTIEEEQSSKKPLSPEATTEEQPPAPQEGLPAPEKFTAGVSKEDDDWGNIWWWIIGTGVVACFFYILGKRKKSE